MDAWIGIDVRKDTLDACLLRMAGKPRHKPFANPEAGIQKLLRWSMSLVAEALVHFCLESTRAYSNAVAMTLAQAGKSVSVENPARIKHFGQSLGQLNKTDRADARLIAEYCRAMPPKPWRMRPPHGRTLTALLPRLESLQGLLSAEKKRLSQPGLRPEVAASLEHTIGFWQAEMQRLQAHIDKHVDSHPDLKADKKLVESIQGIAPMTALVILWELADVDQFTSAQATAAYAGLSPRQYRSGTRGRARTHLCRCGNSRLRGALSMPAMSAVRFNPLGRA